MIANGIALFNGVFGAPYNGVPSLGQFGVWESYCAGLSVGSPFALNLWGLGYRTVLRTGGNSEPAIGATACGSLSAVYQLASSSVSAAAHSASGLCQ